jgi:energy-coupling factor transporter transmembrane protein EcfT
MSGNNRTDWAEFTIKTYAVMGLGLGLTLFFIRAVFDSLILNVSIFAIFLPIPLFFGPIISTLITLYIGNKRNYVRIAGANMLGVWLMTIIMVIIGIFAIATFLDGDASSIGTSPSTGGGTSSAGDSGSGFGFGILIDAFLLAIPSGITSAVASKYIIKPISRRRDTSLQIDEPPTDTNKNLKSPDKKSKKSIRKSSDTKTSTVQKEKGASGKNSGKSTNIKGKSEEYDKIVRNNINDIIGPAKYFLIAIFILLLIFVSINMIQTGTPLGTQSTEEVTISSADPEVQTRIRDNDILVASFYPGYSEDYINTPINVSLTYIPDTGSRETQRSRTTTQRYVKVFEFSLQHSSNFKIIYRINSERLGTYNGP